METPEKEAVMSGDELLRAYLATHDAACAGCGYGLRGLTGPACPECGEALMLGVGARERLSLMWTAGVVAWTMIVPLWIIVLSWIACDWLDIEYLLFEWFTELVFVSVTAPCSIAGLAVWIVRYRMHGKRSWVAHRPANLLVIGVCALAFSYWMLDYYVVW